MNVIVDESQFDTSEVVQSAIIRAEPTVFDVNVDKTQEFVINLPNDKTVQYDEDTWLLYNASVKALTNATLEQLVSDKMAELDTGIYQYINQVSTLKEQLIAEAKALVANLQGDVNTSIATLTKYNNARATENSAIAQNITSLRAGLSNVNINLQANSSAVSELNTTVTDLTGENGPITANSTAVTNLATAITIPGATYGGQTTVLNDLQGSYDAAAGAITTLENKYSVTTKLGSDGNKYITGFGLNSKITVNANGSTNTLSSFNVAADSFNLTHPTSLNQVLMNQDGLYFKKSDGTTAKYLQFIHTYNNHDNEAIITLNNLTRVPQVLMGLHTMPTYKASHADQDQSFTFSIEDVNDDIANSGTYSFKPVAKLHLTANNFTEVLTGTFTDSPIDVKYSDAYHVLTTLNPVTISYNIGSNKGTGTANEFQKRQCSIQMQKSADNSIWTDIGTAVTSTFGESLTTQSGSITYAYDVGANNYIRLKFTFSNASGTFTTGATGYWDYKTASLGTSSLFNRNGFLPEITCAFGNTGFKRDYSDSIDGVTGIMGVTATCNYGGIFDSSYWTDFTQHYMGSGCYSPNDVRDLVLPGYTITAAEFSVSDKTIAGIAVHNNFSWLSGSQYTVGAYDKKPYAYLSYKQYLDSYYDTMSAYIETTISAKKWIEQTGSTTTKNTVTDLALQATAKAGIEIATGSMNIIIVE